MFHSAPLLKNSIELKLPDLKPGPGIEVITPTGIHEIYGGNRDLVQNGKETDYRALGISTRFSGISSLDDISADIDIDSTGDKVRGNAVNRDNLPGGKIGPGGSAARIEKIA
jgi:hypothetical protein